MEPTPVAVAGEMAQPLSVKRPAEELEEKTEPSSKKMRVSELLGIPLEPTAFVPDESKAMLTVSGTWAAAEKISRAIPKDQGLPLTILTGFLGAGKSTVLNYILKADHGMKIAVLINEFGEVDIDNQLVESVAEGEEGEPVVLNNGCICCTVSNGFIDAVQKVLANADERDVIPDYFIVETTGLADPKPIVDSVGMTELREEVYVDQVLTVVDASCWNEGFYGSETARRQIETADTVLLSKTDLVGEERVRGVVGMIREIRPSARVLRSQRGAVPIAALFDLGMSLVEKPGRRKKVENGKKGHEEHEHSHEHKHEHGEECGKECGMGKEKNHLEEEGFSSISFVSEYAFSLRRFKNEFMDELPEGVFRAKGLLLFGNYESRFVFHWSGMRYNVEEDDWPEGAERKNQLVVIGRGLDEARITAMLQGCIVKPGEESDEEDEEEVEIEEEEGEEED